MILPTSAGIVGQKQRKALIRIPIERLKRTDDWQAAILPKVLEIPGK